MNPVAISIQPMCPRPSYELLESWGYATCPLQEKMGTLGEAISSPGTSQLEVLASSIFQASKELVEEMVNYEKQHLTTKKLFGGVVAGNMIRIFPPDPFNQAIVVISSILLGDAINWALKTIKTSVRSGYLGDTGSWTERRRFLPLQEKLPL